VAFSSGAAVAVRELLERVSSEIGQRGPQVALDLGFDRGVAKFVETLEELDDICKVAVTACAQLEPEQSREADDGRVAWAGFESVRGRVRTAARAWHRRTRDEKIHTHPGRDVPQTELADRFETMGGERRSKAGRPVALEEHVHVFGRPRIAVVNDSDPADKLESHAGVFEQRPDGTEGHVDLRQIGVHGASESSEAGERVRGGIHAG
jgi:hypothetical protein